MFTKKDRKIANQKAQIKNRDILIRDLTEKNLILKEENKNGNKAMIILDEIYKLASGNKYNNEQAIFDRIEELAKTSINN